MQIVIIGAGNVGATLGAKWVAAGHTVVFGVRDPAGAKAQAALATTGGAARVEAIALALRAAEVVVLALPGAAVADFVRDYGDALAGKLVIDTTNRFGQPAMNALELLQTAAPAAMLGRAFNSLGWENFAEPWLGDVQADMLYCAPAGEPSTRVAQLISDVGLNPVRAGGLEQAPLIDNLGALWGALAYGQGYGRRVAFKVLLP